MFAILQMLVLIKALRDTFFPGKKFALIDNSPAYKRSCFSYAIFFPESHIALEDKETIIENSQSTNQKIILAILEETLLGINLTKEETKNIINLIKEEPIASVSYQTEIDETNSRAAFG